jgi:hypothetical protein
MAPAGSGITSNLSNNVLTMNYTLASGASDATAHAWWSTDLQNWSNTGVTETILSDNGTIQQWQATLPVNPQMPAVFMRLQITGP